MTKIYDAPFSTNFNGITLAANGQYVSGTLFPNGIPGRLDIIDGVLKAVLYQDDALTNLGLRSEVMIGTFPSNSGEYWSKVEFKLPLDWSYDKLIMIGSWYPTPDGGDGTKHVTIGIRLLGTSLLIIVPDTLPGETLTGRTVARAELVPGEWHTLVCRANLQTGATGFREIYLDGYPILREYNIPTTYTDAAGPYFKFGVYDGNSYGDFGVMSLEFRNATMWSGNDGYGAIMGQAPIIQPRRVSF